jgi:hypothetical protein
MRGKRGELPDTFLRLGIGQGFEVYFAGGEGQRRSNDKSEDKNKNTGILRFALG